MRLTVPSIEPETHLRARKGAGVGVRARGANRVACLAFLAVTVALVLSGCAQNSRTGSTAALPDRQAAREDQSEEQAHSVPPDKFKDVQYRGGRDPTSGVAPGLDGRVEQSPLPPPKGGKSATKTAAGKATSSAPEPTTRTVSGKPGHNDAYRPPAKTASMSSAAPPPQLSPLGEGEIIVVKPGDTVQSIAARYNVPVDALIQANNLRGGRVVPGQRLTLPD